MGKRNLSIILVLALMLSVIIAPTAQAADDKSFILEGNFVFDDGHVLSYEKIATDLEIWHSLSDLEKQRIWNEMEAAVINQYPEYVSDREANLQERRKEKALFKEELISKNELKIAPYNSNLKMEELTIKMPEKTSASAIPSFSQTVYGGPYGITTTSDIPAQTMAETGSTPTNGWADSKAYYINPYGLGSGYAVSACGILLHVQGSGSDLAFINMQGKYNGGLQVADYISLPIPPYNNTHTYASVDIDVYEINPSTLQILSLVTTKNIEEANTTIGLMQTDVRGDISDTVAYYIQAGKSYYIALTVFTSAMVDSGLTSIGNYSRSDMYDDTAGGGPGGEGGDLYSTTITIY